jgi:hypothetical protein
MLLGQIRGGKSGFEELHEIASFFFMRINLTYMIKSRYESLSRRFKQPSMYSKCSAEFLKISLKNDRYPAVKENYSIP